MKKNTKNTILSSLTVLFSSVLIFSVLILTQPVGSNNGYEKATSIEVSVLKQGAKGSNVIALQSKLRILGYYTASVDGIYGIKTTDAVRRYQKARSLPADGIAGEKTLSALGISKTSKYTQNDLNLLARIISAESRGEAYAGQVAVGAVVMNRVRHPSFPDSITSVIYQPGAFSALSDGQFNKPISENAKRAAQDALNGMDPTNGAIYYYNPKTATNKWIKSRPVIVTIGSHIFCN